MRNWVGFLILLIVVSCSNEKLNKTAEASLLELDIPLGFPPPTFRKDNPFTKESVELGRLLFNDPRLSANNRVSCANCHIPEKSFADNHAISPGVNGIEGFRNTPSLLNLAYHSFFFMDGGAPDLEIQMLAPIHTNEEMSGDIHETAALLGKEAHYAALSAIAYKRPLDGYVVTRAIANYERSLISGNSRFDRWHINGEQVLSSLEIEGWELFSSERANCSTCHAGFLFSDLSYQNIGLYKNYDDIGRGRITNDTLDNGKFKVPSLRDVTKTAPYMHDGSIPTLAGVLEHFSEGAVGHANQSEDIRVLNLTEHEKNALLAFFGTLEGDVVGTKSVLQ